MSFSFLFGWRSTDCLLLAKQNIWLITPQSLSILSEEKQLPNDFWRLVVLLLHYTHQLKSNEHKNFSSLEMKNVHKNDDLIKILTFLIFGHTLIMKKYLEPITSIHPPTHTKGGYIFHTTEIPLYHIASFITTMSTVHISVSLRSLNVSHSEQQRKCVAEIKSAVGLRKLPWKTKHLLDVYCENHIQVHSYFQLLFKQILVKLPVWNMITCLISTEK